MACVCDYTMFLIGNRAKCILLAEQGEYTHTHGALNKLFDVTFKIFRKTFNSKFCEEFLKAYFLVNLKLEGVV